MPREGDKLYLHLDISQWATNVVIVREEAGIQYPIYYTNKALLDVEMRNPKMERWALVLVMATRKLRSYFQAYPIIVMTDQPLRHILYNPEASGWLVKWSVELSEFDIRYWPRTTIKAQTLADLVVECTTANQNSGGSREADKEDVNEIWIFMVDGSKGTNSECMCDSD